MRYAAGYYLPFCRPECCRALPTGSARRRLCPCGSCITIFFLLICILPELFQNGRAALTAGMAHKINNPLAGTDYDLKKKYDFRSYFIVTENDNAYMSVKSALGKGSKFIIKISVYRKTGIRGT